VLEFQAILYLSWGSEYELYAILVYCIHERNERRSAADLGRQSSVMSESWRVVANPDAIEPGDAIVVRIDRREIAIFHVGDSFFATDNRCSHAAAPLADGYLDGETIECPLHQGLFNVRTGAALCTPPLRALRTYPLRIKDGSIEILI
jgi:nitrite reductase/ring-hydroxylating ferredoxin subunit